MEINFSTDGDGYEEIRLSGQDDCRIYHHRVLAFAWGQLTSPFFSEDMREVHHENGIRFDNREADLSALTPNQHRKRDPGRRKIRAAWDGRQR